MADPVFSEYPDNSPIAAVRALIPDVEKLSDPVNATAPAEYLFADSMIQIFLALNKGSIRRAAADACEAIGTSEMLILKKMTDHGLTTDGAALAKEYGAKAERLRKRAKDEDDDEEADVGSFSAQFYRRPLSYDPMRSGYGYGFGGDC